MLGENEIGNVGISKLAEALKKHTSLILLKLGTNTNKLLGDNRIGKEGAIALSEALKTVTSLTLLDLGNIVNIIMAVLENNKIGKEGKKAIKRLKLDLPHCIIWK